MSLKSTEETIERMAQLTNKEAGKVARNFSRDLLKKLVKNTPKAKSKKRPVFIEATDGKGNVITRNGEPVMIPLREKGKIVKEKPKGIGFLKAAWLANFERVGMTPKSRIPVLKGAKENSDVEITETNNSASYDIINKVEYARKVNYGSENNEATHFMKKAENDVKSQWDKTIDRIARRKEEQWKKKQLQKLNIKF